MLLGASPMIIDTLHIDFYGVISPQLIFIDHHGIHIMIRTLFCVLKIDPKPSIGWCNGFYIKVSNGTGGLKVTSCWGDASSTR
ncbi:hypothetical protein ES703_41515 [subsurface metagenome]